MYGRTLLNNYRGFAGGTVHRRNAVTALSVRACDSIDNYAALLPRRGPHIASHSVCLSVRLSVRPSRYLSLPSVTSRHLANYNDTHVLFGKGRISYGHLGRTNSCLIQFCANVQIKLTLIRISNED